MIVLLACTIVRHGLRYLLIVAAIAGAGLAAPPGHHPGIEWFIMLGNDCVDDRTALAA